ncbi:HAD family hydrolase [Vaginella massiliensis]|uniref:HAD family hydrolase n=1 Tax=Vaginella massiliensis TaxID=1816680 RepID=UPI0037536E11
MMNKKDKRLKAVLFDMDGVIVDTEPLHTKAYYRVFDELGIDMTPEYFATCTGESTKNVFAKVIRDFNLPNLEEELVRRKRAYFKSIFEHDEEFALLPGVEDLFKVYQNHGIQMVLASSASMNTINWVFEKFDIGKYFLAKVSGDELMESKPNPEIFEIGAKFFDHDKSNCMVIEDSTNGFLAAKGAGIFCAAYRSKNTHLQDYSIANIIVDKYEELYPEKLSPHFDY